MRWIGGFTLCQRGFLRGYPHYINQSGVAGGYGPVELTRQFILRRDGEFLLVIGFRGA